MSSTEEIWMDFLRQLKRESGRRIVYVVGASDSGKSTLCHFLYEKMRANFSCAYIDCDPGQSSLGPPTTLALKMSRPIKGYPGDEPVFLRFIGAVSPVGHLLQTLTGIKRLTDKAIAHRAVRIIIDSSGFVLGKQAMEFQFQVIDCLGPHYLVALQQEKELEPLLANFRRNYRVRIRRFPVADAVVARTPEQRREYRQEKFRRYFSNAKQHEIFYRYLGLHGMVPDLRDENAYTNLLIALCDADNFVLSLGIVQDVNTAESRMKFIAPDYDEYKVRSIQFGSIYLNPDGSQIIPQTEEE